MVLLWAGKAISPPHQTEESGTGISSQVLKSLHINLGCRAALSLPQSAGVTLCYLVFIHGRKTVFCSLKRKFTVRTGYKWNYGGSNITAALFSVILFGAGGTFGD